MAHLHEATSQLKPSVRSGRRALHLGTSVAIAAVGGVLGALVTSFGPTYLEVHIVRPNLAPESNEGHEFRPTPASIIPGPAQTFEAPDQTFEAPDQTFEAPDRLSVEANTLASPGQDAALFSSGDGGHNYLVLPMVFDDQLGEGRIYREMDRFDHVQTRWQAIDEARVTATARGWVGQSFDLYSNAGFVCSATVQGLRLVEKIATDGYSPEDDVVQDGKGPQTPQQWPQDSYSSFIGAHLQVSEGCKGALWGRLSSIAPPDLARQRKLTKQERKNLTRAFRDTDYFREQQSMYEIEAQELGSWDKDSVVEIQMNKFEGRLGSIYSVSANAIPCSHVYANATLFFEKSSDGLTLTPNPSVDVSKVGVVGDFDGDGAWDLIGNDDEFGLRLFRGKEDASLETSSRFSLPIHYCRC